MKRKTSQKQDEILCRRALVIELRSKGCSERKVAEQLGIPRSTIGSDIRIMKRQAATKIQTFIEHELPHEAELLLENANALLRIAWTNLDKDLENGKSSYTGIDSIISILNLKEKLLGNKIVVANNHIDNTETGRVDLEEKQMREAYEAQRHRDERVF